MLTADGILRLTFRLLSAGLPDVGFELHRQPLLVPPRNSEFSLHRVPAGGHLHPTRIGLPAQVRSPRVDDRDAGRLKWRLVARSHTELPGSSNRRDLGIGNRDGMTMPASACDDLWIGLGPIDVERHDALAEQGDDLLLERGGERLAAFAGWEARNAEEQLS